MEASGFSPGESLVVTECAAKGTATGPGDCDLADLLSVTSDAGGRVRVEFRVTEGPFGASNIVCGPGQACLISVTQETPSPTQEADKRISLVGHDAGIWWPKRPTRPGSLGPRVLLGQVTREAVPVPQPGGAGRGGGASMSASRAFPRIGMGEPSPGMSRPGRRKCQ